MAQTPWHFEFANGQPAKLVWQTQSGRTYYLSGATNLPAWAQVAGFPQVATGGVAEYSFSAGTRGFFWITAIGEGPGWQPQNLPALPAGSTFSLSALSALNTNQL
jgi:hypothetical protein